MNKFIYVVEYFPDKFERYIPVGYFKSFKDALAAAKRIDTSDCTWSITERKYGEIDPMEDYRIAFSFDYMAGDIPVKAGELFSVHGARITCARPKQKK